MNHCYRLVFNKSTQVWQAVSEIAKSHSKSAAVVLLPLLSLVNQSYAWAEPAVNALPTGGQVVSGQSAITQNGNQLNIVQGSQKSIINWQSYNIGSNAEVNYVQNNASSISLNRVITGDPSAIFGKLNANGQVWLINPNGVLFGKGAQVNVGGLLATTLNIADDDFLNGHYHFSGNAGSVTNMGSIVANNGGYVAMLAAEVRNEGVISAMQGTVAMAAGNAMTLDFNGNGLINVQVDSANINTLVENKHLIQVGNGQVLMSTKAANGLVTSVINNTGKIEANSMVSDGGVIRLTGAKTVINSGDISATSTIKKGGTVQFLGDNVGMFSTSRVNVSGKTGGGTILVGGDYQGKNANVQNATKTFVSKDAQLIADATDTGDGGKVIVWANDITRYYGSTSAKGGANAGNGGFVEVSGKRLLNFLGSVDLSAANGVGGNLLLDPTNITISNGVDTNTLGFTGPLSVDLTEAFADDASQNSVFDITATTGSFANVTAGSTITLQATNDITIANAFNLATATGTANNSLVLQANNNINVNAALTATGTGSLTLRADADNNGTGTLAVGAAVVTNIGGVILSGASVTSTAAGTIATTGAANANGGNVDITARGAINLAGAITTSGGTAGAATAGRNAGNVTLNAGTSVIANTITANGSNGGTGGQAGGSGGVVNVTANTGITLNNNVNANGGVASATDAKGGDAGTINIRNLDNAGAATGNIGGTNLTARSGNATGTGAGGVAGSINVNNQANTGNVTFSAQLFTDAGVNGNGGNIVVNSEAGVNLTIVNASAGTATTGNAGKSSGNITITGVNRSITGAVTANGGAGLGTNQVGGNAGAISVTGTGTLSTGGIISARNGNATGTGASGLVGSVNVTGTAVTLASITTVGGSNGNGGSITATASGILTLNGAVTSSGGTPNAGAAGANAGAISLAGNSINATAASITASGTNAPTAATNQNGGSGAAVSLSAAGNISTRDIFATGGGGTTTNAKGGDAGSVSITTSAGDITTNGFALEARTGAGQGTGANSVAGFINISNTSVAGSITTNSLNTSSNANGDGGNISVTGNGAVTVSTVTTTSAAATGTRAGRNAGNVTISGLNRSVGAVTTNGGAGAGTNQAGGNAGAVAITGAGTLNVAAINTRTGAASGTGASGLVGSVNLTGSNITAADINTSGQANGNGGAISANASGVLTLNGAILSNGGSAAAAGTNAGAITLSGNSIDTLAAATISASGLNANGTDQAGGNGAAVTITAAGDINIRAVSANGNSAAGPNARGGNAGSIAITTSAGNITTNGGALTAATGAGVGTGAASTAGFINVNNTSAAGTINTGALNTSGGVNGNGGNVNVTGNGAVTLGTVTTTAGSATGTRVGLNAGNIAITGAARTVGDITASGGNGSGADQAGGNGGLVSITGNGAVTTAAITVNGGNGVATNAKAGNAGSITVASSVGNISTNILTARTGTGLGTGADGVQGVVNVTNTSAAGTITVNAVDTRGAANGHGGDLNITGNDIVTVTSTIQTGGGATTGVRAGRNGGGVNIAGSSISTNTITTSATNGIGANQAGGNGGAVSLNATTGTVVTQAITATGGNGIATNGSGGNGGSVTLNAGTGATITMQNITTTGGNRLGTGTVGSGGAITVSDNTLLAANTTINSTSGSAGLGTGGAINFMGTVNSTGGTRTLTINSNAATTFAGAIGNTSALATITTDATGSTAINGGSVTTTGAQTYNDAVTLGAATTFTTTNSNVNFANTINANGNNVVVAAGTGALAASNAANNFGNLAVTAASANIRDADAIVLGATNVTGAYTLQTAGNMTQTAALTLGGVTTLNAGATGDITFNNVANDFNSVAVTSAKNVSLVDSNALTVGASSVVSIAARTLSGNLTLGGNITASGSGDAVVLASAANFINSGSSTLTTPAGRWLIYANTHTGNTFGGLMSGNQAIYNRSFPTATAETGNRYVFANSPSLSVTSTNQSKTYGQDGAPIVANAFTAATFVDAAALGGVFTQDTIANSLTGSATSTGSATTANVGSYAIDVTPITSSNGYSLTKSNLGNLTVNAAVVNIAGNRVYDRSTVFDSGAFSTFATGINSETLNVSGSGGSVASINAGATQSLTIGSLTLANGSGLASNYTLTGGAQTGTITKATLNLNAVTDSKTYDGNTSSLGTVAKVGLVGGDIVTGLTQSFASRKVLGSGLSTLNVDTGYTVDDGNSGNNYTVSTNTAAGTITAATLNLNAVTDSKTYDGNTSSLGTVAKVGLVGGDIVTGLTQSFASRKVLGSGLSTLNVDTGYTVDDGNSGNNYTVSTNTAAGTITAASLSITANNATKVQGSANPLFTSTISGFVGGDTSTVFVGALDYNTLANAASPVGAYVVTPFGVTASNYAISFIDGVLNVTAFIPPANTGNNISAFNNATTRPEQALQMCNQQGEGQAMINGLDAFGLDDVDYQSSISQPQVGGVVANALVGASCLKL